jgi:tRNA uridine 5-carboxymethylaminomethyl modification enzyme
MAANIRCEAVVITTGTFLNGLAHIGEQQFTCGRNGEPPSQVLGDQIRALLGWAGRA